MEFCKAVDALRELISCADKKKLHEELLPIYRYVQICHRIGRYISVCWINGNQLFDAQIFQETDSLSQDPSGYLEVTCAMHKSEHIINELLKSGKPADVPEGIYKTGKGKNREIVSNPIVYDRLQHVNNFLPYIECAIRKKAKINYPGGTTLVVLCYLNTIYMNEDWIYLIESLEERLSGFTIPFQEVLLIDNNSKHETFLKLPRCVNL